MSTRIAAIVAMALQLAACSAKAWGPPEIAVDQTACSHCGMLVSEPVYAAASQAQGQDPRVFDDIGCLLAAVRRETAAVTNVWVQDAAGAGWLDAARATFVESPRVRTPMGGGVLAYATVAAADSAAAAKEGTVVRSFEELINRKAGAR
jgi:copper chaperone NosL